MTNKVRITSLSLWAGTWAFACLRGGVSCDRAWPGPSHEACVRLDRAWPLPSAALFVFAPADLPFGPKPAAALVAAGCPAVVAADPAFARRFGSDLVVLDSVVAADPAFARRFGSD